MKGLKILVLSTLALSIVSPLYTTADVIPPKKTWWKKYGPKIMAGLAIVAAIGITVGVANHANKTKKAIDKAGITDPEDIAKAVLVLSVLGPLGPERALQLITEATVKNVITAKQASLLIFSPIGDALAYYYGMSPTLFKAQAVRAGIKQYRKQIWEEVKGEVQDAVRGLKSLLTRKSK